MALRSGVDPTSSDFARNVEAMKTLVDELCDKLASVVGGGGETARARHTSRGKMLARDLSTCCSIPAPRFSSYRRWQRTACTAATCIRRALSPASGASRAESA